MKLINYLYPQIEEENKITCLQNKIIVGLPSNIYFISLAYGYWQVFPWFLYQFFKKGCIGTPGLGIPHLNLHVNQHLNHHQDFSST